MRRVGASGDDERPAVALLPWGDLFLDWLDPLGVDLDAFRDSFAGSWMFGWVEALRLAGVDATITGVTARVGRDVHFEHRPTGASVDLLSPTRAYRAVAPRALQHSLGGRRDPRSVGGAVLAHAVPYLATPPLRLAALLRRRRYAAVVVQEYESARFDVCAGLGRVLQLPVFATFQGGDYQSSRLEPLVRPLTMRAAAGFVVPTSSEADRIRERYGVAGPRLARIFNPLDSAFWHAEDRAAARAALGLPPAAEVVAWHGQLHPRKGLDVLLEAWAAVRAARPGRDLRLVLTGSGEQSGRDVLASAPDATGVQLVEEWVLDRARLRRALSAADVYAFPSRHEGFPVAPIEAMGCGLPVVATAAQGVRDIFEEGEDHGGIVVERDDVAALAAAIGALLDDEPRRHELGRRARRRVESAFALEPVGRALRAFLVDSTTIRRGRRGGGSERVRSAAMKATCP